MPIGNGFFYVLNRQTGKLIAAIRLVTVNWATHVTCKPPPVEAA